MGTIFVDNIKEHTASHGVHVPGHVIQVVQGVSASQFTSNTTTPASTGLEVSITPKFSTSKILVSCASDWFVQGNSDESYCWIYRGSTEIFGKLKMWSNESDISTAHMSVLDSPNTTSAITYAMYGARVIGSGNAYWGHGGSNNAYITAMEIAQ